MSHLTYLQDANIKFYMNPVLCQKVIPHDSVFFMHNVSAYIGK